MPKYTNGRIVVKTKIKSFDDYDDWKQEIEEAKADGIFASAWNEQPDDDGYGGFYLEIYIYDKKNEIQSV